MISHVVANGRHVLHQINWGGDIPEKYFLSNLMETKGDMEKTTVKMMSTFQVEVEVDIPGTVIRCRLHCISVV